MTRSAPRSPQDEALRDFVAVVLADTEAVWHGVFQDRFGRPYQEPRLVLFAGGVESACGFAGSAVGPFYCPGDNQVYLDLDFFRTLHERRSEEHTSELQSLMRISYSVFCLKNKKCLTYNLTITYSFTSSYNSN